MQILKKVHLRASMKRHEKKNKKKWKNLRLLELLTTKYGFLSAHKDTLEKS